MEKLIFKILFLFVGVILSLVTVTGQILPAVPDTASVYPTNPSAKDSVFVAYSYISTDGCPDFILVQDSVVADRIYVGKKTIDNSNRICTAMVSSFTTKLNLGLLVENTQIYFKGNLIKTIHFDCIMDKVGMVVAGIDGCAGQIFIQELSPISSYRPLYKIKQDIIKDSTISSGLKVGDKVRFGGYLTKNDTNTTVLCRTIGVATCYQLEPVDCIMDKIGLVVAVKDSSTLLKDSLTDDIYVIYNLKLAIGSRVKFNGVKIQCFTTPCYNLVNCYEVIQTPPAPCVMNKVGFVVAGVDGCAGQIFIQEFSMTCLYPLLYTINEDIIDDSTISSGLKVGDKVRFGGYLTKNDSNTIVLCRTIGVATCYELEPADCIMDKVGVVVAGIDGCSGKIFIEDTSYPGLSMIRQLYDIEKNVSSTGILSGELKVGDKVQFGGYLTQKDSTMSILCYTVGVATCYKIIETPACVMNKTGIVVPGIDGCTGQLFIQEYSPVGSARQLYSIKDIPVLNSDSTTTIGLKVGDKVKFGGYLTPKDSSMSILCYTVGVATCYEVTKTESTYPLTGSIQAGSELMKTGYAVLFKKSYCKAIASSEISNGTFEFANLSKAEYTVYVIPDLTSYKNYLPTFYINKLKFKNADYITLNDSSNNVVVNLRKFVLTTGTGKISGNIFFETYGIKDSVLAEIGSKINTLNTIANNTPVILYNSANEPVAWTMTDTNGYYVFENIALGTYKVVAETAAAIAEYVVVLTDNNSAINADLLLKSQQIDTGFNSVESVVTDIYPNPVEVNLFIDVSDDTAVGIYNVLGKLVYNENLKYGVNKLDLRYIGRGIYFVKVGNSTYKIVKK